MEFENADQQQPNINTIYLKIEDSTQGKHETFNDKMDEHRTERIEMLRKSIGRGNRSGHYGNAHNNSFRMEVLSDCGGSNVGQSSMVRKYDEENFAV